MEGINRMGLAKCKMKISSLLDTGNLDPCQVKLGTQMAVDH